MQCIRLLKYAAESRQEAELMERVVRPFLHSEIQVMLHELLAALQLLRYDCMPLTHKSPALMFSFAEHKIRLLCTTHETAGKTDVLYNVSNHSKPLAGQLQSTALLIPSQGAQSMCNEQSVSHISVSNMAD